MEKRLRSSLQSSAEDFISAVTKLTLKSSKPTLRNLIHSINASSDLSFSLPLSLHRSISESIQSFQKLLDPNPSNSNANPSKSPRSPPPKRLRRSSRRSKTRDEHNSGDNESNPDVEKQRVIGKLEILSHAALLCVSHPKRAFQFADLLPCVRELHDNLILFESDSVLLSEIASLCEEWWKEDLPGRELLISQFLPFLLSRSLTMKKKVDVHRVYVLREAFTLFDFEDESIEDLKVLLIRCVIAPLYLKTEEGRKFVAFMFGLSNQLLKEALAMIRSQIPFGRKSMLEAYGDILFRAWKVAEGEAMDEIENGFLQALVEAAIYASSGAFSASIRRILGGFIIQRTTNGIEKLLFRLAEPVIFRSLQVANSNVRQNALHLLLDMFPLEDPDATKDVKDTVLDKQFFLLERLLVDDCPDVRVVAVEGCCRILHLFWEIIPSSTITKIITKIFNDVSLDVCNEIRLSTLNGIIYLFGNPQSHEILRVLLPRLAHLMLDNVLSIRVAVVDLLLLLRDLRDFQFNKVLSLDVLLSELANDQPPVSQKITRLLLPSYFPSKVSVEEACNRCITLIKRSPLAGASFCKYAVSEGASLGSLMELVRVSLIMVLTQKLDQFQIEGLLIAMGYLCSDLVNEPRYNNALKELFAGEKLNSLFALAPTKNAQSSIFNIVSTISPDDVAGILQECMSLVTNCIGLSEDLERQVEVRSAHKLLLSCDGFDDMFEAFTVLLEKTAYRCHIKFGTEMPKTSLSSTKRKKSKSLVKVSSKWKHIGKKKSSNFKEDYLAAAAVAWQIKDLIISEDTQKALLGCQTLGSMFLSLKVISEISIVQCMHLDYVDASPVLAYTALALHIALQNPSLSIGNVSRTNGNSGSDSSSSERTLEQTLDHLLYCIEKLFRPHESRKPGDTAPGPKQRNKATHSQGQRHRKSKIDGSVETEQKMSAVKVKVLMAVLKFIVDATTMGLVSKHGSCLRLTSGYIQYIMSNLEQQSRSDSELKDAVKNVILCLKISFTYAAKLLNQVLRHASKTSQPPIEAFDLANNLLNLIISMELYMGSNYAARLVSTAKPWLPDLILALGAGHIMKTIGEETQIALYNRIKLCFPSWLSTAARLELSEISDANLDEDEDRTSEQTEFPAFNNLLGMFVTLLKSGRNILDAIGVIFLIGSVVGIERKDFELVLGLVHFVCVKLFENDDKEWGDLMLAVLQDIFPRIEREIEEQCDDETDQKLLKAKVLLEPIWMYHIYETGKVSVMEE